MTRTTSTSFRLPNHIIGQLRLTAADVGCSQAELIHYMTSLAHRDRGVRNRLRAIRAAVAFLDELADMYDGPGTEITFIDKGNRELAITIGGEEPPDLRAEVVDVEGSDLPMIRVVHTELDVMILPVGGYHDTEEGDTWTRALRELYPA
jgi:hypothetical protein